MAILKIKDKGVWKEIQAIKGDTGNGIQNIEKVSTVENVDTYAINYTDGTQTTFDVTNGEVTKEQLDEVDNRAKKTRNELERVKNDVLETGTATDTFVHLEDSAMAEYQELSVDGVCEQETTTGKNLLNVPSEYIVTGNKVININMPTGSYVINWEDITTDGTGTDMLIYFYYEDDTTLSKYISPTYTSKSLRFKTTKNVKKVGIYSQETYNNSQGITTTFKKLMISTDGGTYEPYTGGQPSPSPDYPQEIEVGRGKNLFDESQLLQAEGWTYSNGYYNGSVEKYYVTFRYGFNFNTTFEENTQYTIKLNAYTTGGTPRFKIEYTDGTNHMMNFSATTPTNYSYTTTNGKTISKIVGEYGTGGSQTLYLKDLQLEKGSVATSYLPYNTIEVKSTGKNLFNKDNATTQVGYFSSNGAINSGSGSTITTSYTSILPNTDMTISGFALESICFYDKNKNFIERVVGALKTFNKNAYYIRIQASTNVFDLSKIQLEEGSTATDYEPYKESSITANLPEGEFIGKISDIYKDTLKVEYNEDDGQHHLKLYKNVGKVVLDGSEQGWVYDSTYKYFRCPNYNFGDKIPGSQKIKQLSNYFIVTSDWSSTFRDNVNTNIMFVIANSGYRICIRNINYSNVEDFKIWLSTHNTEVYYALAEPYAVDLGVVDMPITYNEITNLFTDSNLSLTINAKYYRNFISTVRNLQVNEKALKQELVDINTRLSALESAQTSVISESEVVE